MADDSELMGRQVFRNQDALERQLERLVKLETNFDHSPKQAHLDKLETEMMRAFDVKLTHICEHLDKANTAQSEKLIHQVNEMLTNQQLHATSNQLAQNQALIAAMKETRREIIRYGIGFALTIITGLILFYLTTGRTS